MQKNTPAEFVLQLIKIISNQYRISNTGRGGPVGFEPTTSAIVNCEEYNRPKACFAESAGMCSATMVSLKPERKLKKERLEETMIQQTSFERKTGEQVSALVQTLKRMIAGESDSDVYDLKNECKALDTIFNHAIAPGWLESLRRKRGVQQAI